MKWALVLCLLPGLAQAADEVNGEIYNANKGAVVFIEALRDNQVVDTGSGVLISPDGYVVTVGHLRHPRPDTGPVDGLRAGLGSRTGPRYELEELDWDPASDVSLLRLTTSTCLPSAKLSLALPRQADRVVVIGFNEKQPISALPAHIATPHGLGDLYNTDAPVTNGSSGAPVFDMTGAVIALVQGGTSRGRRDVDLIPISRLLPMLLKFNVFNAIEAAAQGCGSRDAAELFNPHFHTLTVKGGAPALIDVDLVRQGQEISLCIGTFDRSLAAGNVWATLSPASGQVPGGLPFGIPFRDVDRTCRLQSGVGSLYVVNAPKEDRYKITLFRAPKSSWFGPSTDDTIVAGVGYGTR